MKQFFLTILFISFFTPFIYCQVIINQPQDSIICENSNASFSLITNSLYSYSFQWQQDSAGLNDWADLPDDTLSILALDNVSLSYNGYKFRCIVDTNGIPVDTSQTASLIVNQLPDAIFSSNTVCFGDSTKFTNQSINGNTWDWNFNDNATSVLAEPYHIFSHAGNFNVSLVAISAYGCTDTVINQITVFPSPLVNFTVTEKCLNDTTAFYNLTSDADTYFWNFGENGVTSTVQNPTHLYQNSDNFNVTLIAYNSYGCVDSLNKTAIVNPLPVADFVADTVCYGLATSFTDASTLATNWNWDFDDNGSTSFEQNPGYIFSITDTFNVQLVAITVHGCKDTVNKIVFVNPLPNVDFTATEVCYKDTTQFTNNTAGAVSYVWNFDDNSSSSNLVNPEHLYGQSGYYNVKLIATTDKGCSDSLIKTATVNPLPAPAINGTSLVCANESGMMYSTPYLPGNSYQWETINGTIENGQWADAVTIHWDSVPGITTSLAVTETIDNTGCTLTTPLYNVSLTNNFAPDKSQIQLKGTHILVCMDFTVDSWQWYYDGNLIPGATEHYYPADATATGDYWCVTSFLNGCDTESDHFNFATTGIEDNDFAKTIKIYPNPSNGEFYVEMVNEYYGEISIEILDNLNKTKQNNKFKKNTTHKIYKIEINQKGNYFIILKMSDLIIIKKILILN